MTEARIGRVTAAALHESLATHLPFRVEFYEHWLQPPRLRSGTVGMASFLAVLSFMRQEGEIYNSIVGDAGRLAAEWVFNEVSWITRLRWRWLPRTRRMRAALRLVRRLSAEATPATRCRVRWQRRKGRVIFEESPFCSVRAAVQAPLCGFYSAALLRFAELLDTSSAVETEACRATGAPHCSISLSPAVSNLSQGSAPPLAGTPA
jgi:hypothetical protein